MLHLDMLDIHDWLSAARVAFEHAVWPQGWCSSTKVVPECGNTSVQVLPGARMPVDGLVLSGRSHADESMLTGEAEPMLKAEGDAVIGGTMNLGGSLQVRHSCAT